ncbi:MAG: hypothetical protein ACRDYX_13945 [Egibacteraceae bacterium]
MPGVVLLPGAPDSYERSVMIVIAAVGGRALAARLTAAYLHGMVREAPKHIAVVTPHDRQIDPIPGARLHLSRTLMASDATLAAGIPCTTGARTILDCAMEMTVDELRFLVIDARQRRLVTLDDAKERYSRMIRPPHGGKIRRVLLDLDEETCDSAFEWRWRKAVRQARLPPPYPRPFPWRCPDGVVIELDVAWPWAWVASECNGMGFHSAREDLAQDHLRQNAASADWQLILVDWDRLIRDPSGLIAEVHKRLASADPTRPPAVPADRRPPKPA